MAASRSRKTRRRAPMRPTIVTYAIRIDGWGRSYHFGANPGQQRDGGYAEHRHLKVFCVPS